MKISSEWFQGVCESCNEHASVIFDDTLDLFQCVKEMSLPLWQHGYHHFREIPGSITNALDSQREKYVV